MVELVAERGYRDVTVRALTERAHVSKRAFYEHFDHKEACFLDTCDALVANTADRIIAAGEEERDPARRLRAFLGAFAEAVAAEPDAARLLLVEALGAGPASLAHVARSMAVFRTLLGNCLGNEEGCAEVPPILLRAIIAGVVRVARTRLLEDRETELPGCSEEIGQWALSLRSRELRMVARDWGHRLTGPDEIEEEPRVVATDDDRTVILAATARLGAQTGYRELSIPRIRATAGLSRKRFDQHFKNLSDCFFAALEERTKRALADAATHGANRHSWPAGVHQTLVALCAHIARDPKQARLVFLEVLAAGPEGVGCRSRLITCAVDCMTGSAPLAQRPSPLAAEASVGAIWGVFHHYLAQGRAELLPHVAPVLSYLVLAPAIGASAAAQTIHEECYPTYRGPKGR